MSLEAMAPASGARGTSEEVFEGGGKGAGAGEVADEVGLPFLFPEKLSMDVEFLKVLPGSCRSLRIQSEFPRRSVRRFCSGVLRVR